VISAYTAVVYWLFRGKQRKGYTPTSAPLTHPGMDSGVVERRELIQ